MKDNCEGDEITPNFYVADHKTIAKQDDVFNGDEVYFVYDPKYPLSSLTVSDSALILG